MKVVGTGSPRLLTIRFEPCELPLLRDEIEEHQRSALSSVAEQQTPFDVHPGASDGNRRMDRLVTFARLQDELRGPLRPEQPLEVTGPTDVIGEIIRAAAGEAVYRLHEDVDLFRQDRGTPSPEQLRARLSSAAASIESLIGLDHAVNHGVH